MNEWLEGICSAHNPLAQQAGASGTKSELVHSQYRYQANPKLYAIALARESGHLDSLLVILILSIASIRFVFGILAAKIFSRE